jgi:hypothetical protein
MLRDEFSDHFEMTEFLDGDVLKHVPDAGIFDVKRLHPILQGGPQFARCAAKLFPEVRACKNIDFAIPCFAKLVFCACSS